MLLLTSVYLIGNNAVSLWDRDEPRYAQASRQMLDSGDWTTPRLLDELRLKKPPFIYWCQAAAMKCFGVSAGAARLPSVIATTLTLVLVVVALSRGVDPQTAVWTAVIYGTAGLTIAAAKMSITDAVLTFFTLSALICLYRMSIGLWDWPTVIAMGSCVGLAGLTKGPVVLGVLGTTLLMLAILNAFCGSTAEKAGESDKPRAKFRLPKITIALLLAGAVVMPWIIALESRHPGAIGAMLHNEVLSRIAKPQEGHRGPPGFYLLAVWGTFFPWSLLIPAAMADAWRCRHDVRVRFALAAIVGPWIMFECIATKLPHYVLPTYAPMAFLVARVLLRASTGATSELRQRNWPLVARGWAGFVAMIGLFPWLAVYWFAPLPAAAIVASAVVSVWAILFAWRVAVHFANSTPMHAAGWMAAGILGVFILCYGILIPHSPYLNLSRRAADVSPPGLRVGDVLMIDYKEPSLAFYQGGTIRPEPRDDFLSVVEPAQWPAWIVTTSDVWKTVPEPRRALLEVVRSETGWSYAGGGRRIEVIVLKFR